MQAAYGRPIDIEFAWDDGRLYILQCRSLSTRREIEAVNVPADVSKDDTLFIASDEISSGLVTNIEYILYVDPRAYDRLESFEQKAKVGWAVGQLNQRLGGKRFALLGPGRWGSNDINLGVRVSYADINNTKLLVEISFARDGYTPEVSYGTHFFQDLVEADIAVMPLYPDNPGSYLSEGFLLGSPNSISALDPSLEEYADIVHLIHVPKVCGGRYLHAYLDGESQRGAGIFAEKIGVEGR